MKLVVWSTVLFLTTGTAGARPGSLFIENLTWIEIRGAIASGKTTALYVAGSTEECGPHMPVGKHNFLAHYAAERIAEELGNALIYPTMPFAPTGDPLKKTDLMAFPGSISISDETFGSVARDVATSAIAAGFRNVILMGEHGGGLDALKRAAGSLDAIWSPKGVRVYYADGGDYEKKIAEYLKVRGLVGGEHAGIPDTSKLMFIDSERKWVRLDKLAPGGVWEETGVDGDPTLATIEIGRAFMDIEVQEWVAQIRRLLGN